MAKRRKLTDRFVHAVEQALEHYGDAEWLGAHSPLASPYFIGRELSLQASHETTGKPQATRGHKLQAALKSAAFQLGADDQALLNTAFFGRDRFLTNVGVARALNESKTSYYRHRKDSIAMLAAALNRSVVPPLRLELPHARSMVGRAIIADACLATLQEGRSVTLTGPGGIGKTTLGLDLTQRWGAERVFWLTLRPGLNDQTESLIFALAYFLRGLGVSALWQQLVADKGASSAPQLLGLLRHDLVAIKPPPLVCVDEVEILNADNPRHALTIHLLEELRELVPLFLMGQRLVIDTSAHYALAGLKQAELTALLVSDKAPPMAQDEQQRVTEATRGNPAMMKMIITLWREGEPLGDLLGQLSRAPGMEVLLNRIWRRLSADERLLLAAISSFRGAAPADAWARQRKALDQLLACDLVHTDAADGLLAPKFVQEFVERQLTPELRIGLQQMAGEVREVRAEFTEAAYHYIAGRQSERGVWTWFAHRSEEIEKGRATVARTIFNSVAIGDLSHVDDQRALSLIRGELLQMLGEAERAEEALRLVTWPTLHSMTPLALELIGNTFESRGQFDRAVQHYRDAIDATLVAPDRRRIGLYAKVGHVHLIRERNFLAARHDAAIARIEVERLQGHIEEESGKFERAESHYEAALVLSEAIDAPVSLIRIHSDLGRLQFKRGNADLAIKHLQHAIEMDEARDSPAEMAIDRLNLSGAYIAAQNYELALEQARMGLAMAEAAGDAYAIAGLASNAGEACYYLGRLDDAEQFALQSLRQEEYQPRPYALTVLGSVRRDQANWHEAESLLNEAIKISQANQDPFAEASAWRALGLAYEKQGEKESAAAALAESQRLTTAMGLYNT